MTDSPETPPKYRLVISADNQRVLFLGTVLVDYANTAQVSTLEIHLNASKNDDFVDDKIAIALQPFHDVDGVPFHSIQTIKLVISGNILYTRHNYSLASPAISSDVTSNIDKLMAGTLHPKEQINLPFKVNSTEKSTAKALLAIRGVKNVVIQNIGKAQMEQSFYELVQHALKLPHGTEISLDVLSKSEQGLNRKGPFWSGHYFALNHPYPIRDYIVEPIEDSDDETNKPKHQRSQRTAIVQNKTSPSTPSRRSKRNKNTETAAQATQTPVEDEVEIPEGFAMHNMQPINSTKQDADDTGVHEIHVGHYIDQYPRVEATTTGDAWIVLTGKGNNTQLGWKIK